MEELKITNLLNLDETIASNIFENTTYPWEVLSKIEYFICTLGNRLDGERFIKKRGKCLDCKNC